MSVFLTPDLKPFFGGTYFPPDSRHGRPGFLQVLQHISGLWDKRKHDLAASANEIHARLHAAAMTGSAAAPVPTDAALKNAAALFQQAFDPQNGGFGNAPKFPQPSLPQLLLRCAKRFRDDEAARMVMHTCERMAAGGIHDQLGGGFARYSVDAEWLVPHFEKMLYDNAQLAHLYLDAYLVSTAKGESRALSFAAVARDILDYVLRDMTHPDGGFFSAEDADSEGQEGKFYCWTREELSQLLSPEEFNVAAKYFGITAEGNFLDHSHPQPLRGLNVLSVVDPVGKADEKLLESAKQKMFAARGRRVRPHLDDKVLVSWNGLMLEAFARAAAVLNEPKYRAAAEKNLQFIRRNLWTTVNGRGTLCHRWRDGQSDRTQLLEDYAFLLPGVLSLYETTLEPACLSFAIELANVMVERFFDSENGGFWQSVSPDLLFRLKDDYDGAEPSGNSVAVLALLKLGAITGQKPFTAAAEKTLRLFAERIQKMPQAMPFLLHGLDFWLQDPVRVVIAGDKSSPPFHELLRAAHSVYQPNKVVLGVFGEVDEFSRTLPPQGQASAYVCRGHACLPPADTAARLKSLIA